MPRVLIEREYDEAQVVSDLQTRQEDAMWCFKVQRVRPVRSYVARDQRYLVCTYDAPDAEAVRTTQRTANVLVTRAWTANVLHEEDIARPEGYALVVALRALPEGTTREHVEHLLSDPKGRRRRLRIQLLGAYLSLDARRALCCYYSPDVESVRISSRESGVPLERAWSAELIEPKL